MGNVLKLFWWLLMLSALQASACILDGFRYIGWGLFGYLVLKGMYLAFAGVLLFRYRSFRRQRAFEGLAETYQKMSGKDFAGGSARRESRLHPFLTWAMLALAVMDAALAWFTDLTAFRATIALDLAIWLLMSRWVARACWLRSRGARERLKEAVDDARSRARAADPDSPAAPARVSPAPFVALAAMSLALSLGFGIKRWVDAEAVSRMNDLQRCMDACMRQASMRFYQQGEGRGSVADEPCVRRLEAQVDLSLDWSGGELRLRAVEKPDADYFGDGRPGDEGLALDGNGNFGGLSDRRRPGRLLLP